MTQTADIVEVFSGIQGEGIYVGRRQLFVRFAGCNRACEYCDTPESRRSVPFASVETKPGGRTFRKRKNPLTAEAMAWIVAALDADRLHDSINLTGGEPLLSVDFITALAPLCEGREFYLETNGTLPRELHKVVHLVRTIALDIKLASATGEPTDLDAARQCLELARGRDVFVKVIVSHKTSADEIAGAARVVASVRREIPFVIQPVTSKSVKCKTPAPARVLELQAAALAHLADVRVIPQVHKLMRQK